MDLDVKTMAKEVSKEILNKEKIPSYIEMQALLEHAFLAGVLIGGNDPEMHKQSIEWFNKCGKGSLKGEIT